MARDDLAPARWRRLLRGRRTSWLLPVGLGTTVLVLLAVIGLAHGGSTAAPGATAAPGLAAGSSEPSAGTSPAGSPATDSTAAARAMAGQLLRHRHATARQLRARRQAQARAARLRHQAERVARAAHRQAARMRSQLPMEFRVSTFNLLGYSHTARGGDRHGWAPGTTRMRWAVSLLRGADVDVVGFQELQEPQYRTFRALVGAGFGVYPGTSLGAQPLQDSIAWRTDHFDLVEAHTTPIPYFHGRPVPMPSVLLRDKATGRQVWFVNVHNPADKFGRAQRWRDAATAREAALVNQLRADGTPVLLTGDMNDRARAFCSIAPRAGMGAANGGSVAGGCHPPTGPTPVDWIFGSTGVDFTGYTRQDRGLVRRTTDHPFVWAAVRIAGGSR